MEKATRIVVAGLECCSHRKVDEGEVKMARRAYEKGSVTCCHVHEWFEGEMSCVRKTKK